MAGQVVVEDSRQQAGKHDHISEWMNEHKVEFWPRHSALEYGDYIALGKDVNRSVSIDTKRGIGEVAKNINGKEHTRFKREIERAQNDDKTLIVLVENRFGCRGRLDDCYARLREWRNEHCSLCGILKSRKCVPETAKRCALHNTRVPIQGDRLAKAMKTMQDRYNVEFMFCIPENTAHMICHLLNVRHAEEAEVMDKHDNPKQG